MARIKKSLMGEPHKTPVFKKTTQGQGRRSRPKPGKKLMRGQGK